jgi:hypothetical protein
VRTTSRRDDVDAYDENSREPTLLRRRPKKGRFVLCHPRCRGRKGATGLFDGRVLTLQRPVGLIREQRFFSSLGPPVQLAHRQSRPHESRRRLHGQRDDVAHVLRQLALEEPWFLHGGCRQLYCSPSGTQAASPVITGIPPSNPASQKTLRPFFVGHAEAKPHGTVHEHSR